MLSSTEVAITYIPSKSIIERISFPIYISWILTKHPDLPDHVIDVNEIRTL